MDVSKEGGGSGRRGVKAKATSGLVKEGGGGGDTEERGGSPYSPPPSFLLLLSLRRPHESACLSILALALTLVMALKEHLPS